jgi:hypothetical protein
MPAKRPPVRRRGTVQARINTFAQAAAISARVTGVAAE